MRQTIRAAEAEGYQRIAVVCGAWHGPALVKRDNARADAALLEAASSTASRQLAFAEQAPSRFALSRAACARLLPLLGRTGRFRLSRPSGDVPLVWHEPPWALRLRVTAAPLEGSDALPSWDVHGVVRSGAIEVPLTELDALLEGGFAIAGGRLGRVDDGGASSWLGMLVTHRRVRITPARRAAFLEELYSLPAGDREATFEEGVDLRQRHLDRP